MVNMHFAREHLRIRTYFTCATCNTSLVTVPLCLGDECFDDVVYRGHMQIYLDSALDGDRWEDECYM